MRHAALAAVVALVLASPMSAQQPAARDTARHRMMGHAMQGQAMGSMGGAQGGMAKCGMMEGGMGHDSAMGGMMEGMMTLMEGSADHLLARKSALHLTADQEHRITAIRDAAAPEHAAAMRDAAHHGQELGDVMRAAAPDTTAMKHHFDGMLAAMGQAHVAMLRSAALARAVLTDAQRHQADSLAARMGCGMMGSHARAATPAAAHRH